MTLTLALNDMTQVSLYTRHSQHSSSPLHLLLTEWKRATLPFRKRMQSLVDGYKCQKVSTEELQVHLQCVFFPGCFA